MKFFWKIKEPKQWHWAFVVLSTDERMSIIKKNIIDEMVGFARNLNSKSMYFFLFLWIVIICTKINWKWTLNKPIWPYLLINELLKVAGVQCFFFLLFLFSSFSNCYTNNFFSRVCLFMPFGSNDANHSETRLVNSGK